MGLVTLRLCEVSLKSAVFSALWQMFDVGHFSRWLRTAICTLLVYLFYSCFLANALNNK